MRSSAREIPDAIEERFVQRSRDCAYSAGSVQADGTRQCLKTGTITFLANPNRTRIAGVQSLTLERTDPNPEGTKAGRTRCSDMPIQCSRAPNYPKEFNGQQSRKSSIRRQHSRPTNRDLSVELDLHGFGHKNSIGITWEKLRADRTLSTELLPRQVNTSVGRNLALDKW